MQEDLDECTYVVPLESIVNPLCVFKNYGGQNREYFCPLPQRKWGRYFGDKILGEEQISMEGQACLVVDSS